METPNKSILTKYAPVKYFVKSKKAVNRMSHACIDYEIKDFYNNSVTVYESRSHSNQESRKYEIEFQKV
jgi:hypothetical protein